jgi:hypothetical protein
MAARWVMTEPFLLCAACGDRIGMYEPLWCELPDGTLGLSSYLNLSCEQRRGRSRLWHLGCLAPDAVPAEIESLGPGRAGGPLGDPGGGGSPPYGDHP